MKAQTVFNEILELEKRFNLLSCDAIHEQDDLFIIQEILTDLLIQAAGNDQQKIKKLAKDLPYLFNLERV